MKKNQRLISVLLSVFLVLSLCVNGILSAKISKLIKVTDATETTPANEATSIPLASITSQATADVEISTLTLLKEQMVDMNGDGTGETVSLYTQAGRDSSGEIMWDDGQVWQLIVNHGSESYVLFNDYVQLSELQVYAYQTEEQGKMTNHLLTIQSGINSAGMLINTYTFIPNENRYEKKPVFNEVFVNGFMPMLEPYQ